MITIDAKNHSHAIGFYNDTNNSTTHLIINDCHLIAPSFSDGMDTCSFYSGPSESTIMAFGQRTESCGSMAYAGGGESCGSVAYAGGGESCGSIATSSGSSFGGSCNLSC